MRVPVESNKSGHPERSSRELTSSSRTTLLAADYNARRKYHRRRAHIRGHLTTTIDGNWEGVLERRHFIQGYGENERPRYGREPTGGIK